MNLNDILEFEIIYNKDGTQNKTNFEKIQRILSIKEQLSVFECDPNYTLDHIALVQGQLSRKAGCRINEYSGNYGKGYTVDVPYFGVGSKYIRRCYYIRKDNNNGRNTDG